MKRKALCVHTCSCVQILFLCVSWPVNLVQKLLEWTLIFISDYNKTKFHTSGTHELFVPTNCRQAIKPACMISGMLVAHILLAYTQGLQPYDLARSSLVNLWDSVGTHPHQRDISKQRSLQPGVLYVCHYSRGCVHSGHSIGVWVFILDLYPTAKQINRKINE